jgi:uncharacterized protein YhfF
MKPIERMASFWQKFGESAPEWKTLSLEDVETWHFCDNEEDANEVGELARKEIKTATCSLLWAYEAENEELPQVGELSLVTNWDGNPLCIIETSQVTIHPFNEVDAQFAYEEGEGDRSLKYWREVHWEAFKRECTTIGREPQESMRLVCERFKLLFSG